MKVIAICETCSHQHPFGFDPLLPSCEFSDWRQKHLGHAGVEFLWPERTSKPSWVDYLRRCWAFGKAVVEGNPSVSARSLLRGRLSPDAIAAFLHNANVKTSYAASATISCAIASLATSSTKLAGYESAAVDNTSNLYLDYSLGGVITVGTTPTTGKSIDVCLVAPYNDTPTWPDVFDGTESAETVTNQEIKDQICKPFTTISIISTSSSIGYNYGPGSVAARFGGVCPLKFVLFISHDTAVNLNATGGNHVQSATGQYITTV